MNILKLAKTNYFNGRADTLRTLNRYKEDNKSLIAYFKDDFTLLVLIKTKRKYMAFIVTNLKANKLKYFNDGLSYFCYNVFRLQIKSLFELFNSIDKTKIHILNKEEYNKLEKKQLLNSLIE